jgi:hypothetical protein
MGVRVINLPYNLGIGGAVQTGFIIAEREGYDAVAQFDGGGICGFAKKILKYLYPLNETLDMFIKINALT